MGDETRIFMGTPSKEEIMRYFARQQSKQRIKRLQEDIYDRDSSPELSDSFQIELEQRKKKVEAEKMRLVRELEGQGVDKENKEPETSTASNVQKKMSLTKPNETLGEESFLEMEKMCERTLNLNNVTEPVIDLTSIDDYDTDESFQKELGKKKSLGIGDETRITEIEAPSFIFNNTSLLSPNKNSPIKMARENRPSTIMEVTETSISNRTAASSYVTAKSSGSAERSEYYQTASESLEEIASMTISKKPTMKPFYDDELFDLTKDSLDATEKDSSKQQEITVDSLNSLSKVNSSSGVDSSYDAGDESINFDDTLDRMDFMLAQATKMKETQLKTPVMPTIKLIPATPRSNAASPAANRNASPSPWSAPKVKHAQPPPTKVKLTPISGVKNSPLVKLSPAPSTKSPAMSNFKLPTKPASTSKIPQFSTSNSKKFQHIVSPISLYINHTPELPLGANAHIQYGAGSSRFNFRDSESFNASSSSMNMSVQASSLPMRAKTKTSSAKRVIDQRFTPTIPGGKKVQNLLANSSPTVTIHKGHEKASGRDLFQNNTLDDTALSEQSFADLSLMTGDVSVQVVEGIKRLK